MTPRRRRWRSLDRVGERCQRIRELGDLRPALTLMEIALKIKAEFGSEETGKPLDHSTVIHHLHGKCTHDRWLLIASARQAIGSAGAKKQQ